MIGCDNTSPKIVNGAFLTVTKPLGEGVELRDEDSGEVFEISVDQLAAHTRLRWALTLVSVQGRTLEGNIGIHDFRSKFFSLTHLSVSLSRAANGAHVFLIPPCSPALFSPPLK